MTETERIVPELRFKGFIDDWEQRKLGELASVYDGTHQTPDYKDKGVMFLSVENIKTLKSKKYISEEAFSKEFTIRPEKNDVLMTRIGDVGTANVVADDTPIAYYVSLALLKSKLLNPFFLQASIHSPFMKDELWKRTLHIAFPKKINKNEIANVPISYPSIEEQTKIGSFFKQLDDTIALHQRKLVLLKQLKQTYLQVMFPQNGENSPALRLDGFSEPWGQRKLIEMANFRRGSFPQPYGDKKWYDETNGMPFVQVVDVGNNLRLVNNTKQKISKLAQPKSVFVEAGKVVVTLQGSIGRVAITQYPSYVDRTLLIFERYKQPIDEYYFAYVIQQLFEIEKRTAPGGTIKTITKEVLSDFLIHIPEIDEQQTLGKYFRKLDDTIALHQQKVTYLQSLKSTLLNKMFI